jgi:hypothetical protein
MCTQDILQFNIIICPIFFAKKCGHVFYFYFFNYFFDMSNLRELQKRERYENW